MDGDDREFLGAFRDEINGRFDRQNEKLDKQQDQIDRLVRAVFGDDDTPKDSSGVPMAMAYKVNVVYSIVETWRAVQKLVVAVVIFLLGGSGAAALGFIRSLGGGG